MNVPFVDLKSQYQSIKPEIQAAINAVLDRGDYILGQDVKLFEEEFSAICEVKHTIACSNGTDALVMALQACGIGSGDEVITVANTWVSTVFAITTVGAKPVFADIDPDTHLIDLDSIRASLSNKTKAILPVHLYGQACDMTSIMQIAKEKNLKVIEDACQAHLSEWKGQKVGSFGDAAAFSFYPGKNLGAYGDAGCVTTNDPQVADRIRLLQNMGQKTKHHHECIGLNMRMDTLQAAILRVKLKHLEQWTNARRTATSRYHELLEGSSVKIVRENPNAKHVYHLFVVECDNRDEIVSELQSQGVGAQIHYPTPIHLQPCYQSLGLPEESLLVTKKVVSRILSLPIYPEITEHQQKSVVSAVNNS